MRDTSLPPTTLYKLIDDSPQTAIESVLNLTQVKTIITEELSSLLNSQRTSIIFDPQHYPEIETSVLNYGLGLSVGSSLSAQHCQAIETAIRTAIVRFESRIDPNSLSILITNDTREESNAYQFKIIITAYLLALPENIPLTLSGVYDAESCKTLFDNSYQVE